MKIAEEIEKRMLELLDGSEALHLMRFFKCGPGEYGEGDRFLGIRVPKTRALVKEYRQNVTPDDCIALVKSQWHEIRLAGFLLLIELYNHSVRRKDKSEDLLLEIYLDHIPCGNNWDLVDLVAPKILGERLSRHPEQRIILDRLSDTGESLWHSRVAIVATLTLIINGEFDDTFRLVAKNLSHRHDLIHKAMGWMLREIGKRGGRGQLVQFLDTHISNLPRTTLRYAIEHFPEPLRKLYLTKNS